MWSADQAAVRAAVADILIFISGDRCSEEKLAEIQALLEKAVELTRGEEIKA